MGEGIVEDLRIIKSGILEIHRKIHDMEKILKERTEKTKADGKAEVQLQTEVTTETIIDLLELDEQNSTK